jgi:hypothetical protein
MVVIVEYLIVGMKVVVVVVVYVENLSLRSRKIVVHEVALIVMAVTVIVEIGNTCCRG